MTVKCIRPKILVCQRGARHRYAIPERFNKAGMLAALYTDSSAYSLAGKTARWLCRKGVDHALVKSLASRSHPDIPAVKVYSFDRLLLPGDEQRLSRAYIKKGLQSADAIYSMCGEEFNFLKFAKEQGCKIILDVFIHPGTTKIIENEYRELFGDASDTDHALSDGEPCTFYEDCFELADIILCPSNWVAEGVREVSASFGEKIRVIPYGSSLKIDDSINRSPMPGRILFAGRDPIRKGLHYLADAAKLLRDRGFKVDIRVAGVSRNELGWIKNREELNCLGTLPLDQMRNEFRNADVFVLPSLSEGQAGVVLEAMACGCPIIATRESGVDFNPVGGITVPVRDANALAKALINVIDDRHTRNELAQGALNQAIDFSLEAWGERLASVLNDALQSDTESTNE